ncbi:MAG: hypothetical protein WBA22_06410 [Candidatus Methanofastidiosia archaeon]
MAFRANCEIWQKTEDKKNMGLGGSIWGTFVILLLLSTFCTNDSNEPFLTENPTLRSHPAIYGDIVVWEDSRKGKYDIYGYDFSTDQEFQITTNLRHQWSPAIYENVVVWMDDRNWLVSGLTPWTHSWDIYGCNLSLTQPSSAIPLTTEQEGELVSESKLENLVLWLENDLVIRTIKILAAVITVSAAIYAVFFGKYKEWHEKRRIYNWLRDETIGHESLTVGFPPEEDPRWKTSMEIANGTNLPIERVRHLCRIHERIVAMPKDHWPNELWEDFWAIKDFVYM